MNLPTRGAGHRQGARHHMVVPCKMLANRPLKSPILVMGNSSLKKKIFSSGSWASLEVLVAYEHDPF